MEIRRVGRDVEEVELITDWMLGVKERKEFWETSRFLAWQRVDKAGIRGLVGWVSVAGLGRHIGFEKSMGHQLVVVDGWVLGQ